VVEDNDATRSFINAVLLRCGAKATLADSVQSAIDVLETRKWDAIITDIALPGADGYALLSHIRRVLSHPPPVAALTAFGSADDKRMIREAGFARHLVKPIDPVIFARSVASLVS
jgi:CheY-like chemotaxis protein